MKSSAARWLPDPWIAVFVVTTGGSVLLALGFSALYGLGLIGTPSSGLTLAHWQAVLTDRGFWIVLGFSLGLTVATLTLCMVSALAVVLLLAEQLCRPPLGILIYLPLAVPGVVAALVSYQVLGDGGLLARIARALGWISQPSEFPSLVFDRHGVGIVLTHWAMVTPFFVILLDRLMDHERIPEFRQLAQALGASEWAALRRVILPLLSRGALPLCTVYGVVLLAAFEVPLLIGARFPNMISVEIHERIGQLDLALRPQGFVMATLYLVMLSAAWWLGGRWLTARGSGR